MERELQYKVRQKEEREGYNKRMRMTIQGYNPRMDWTVYFVRFKYNDFNRNYGKEAYGEGGSQPLSSYRCVVEVKKLRGQEKI